MNLEKSVRCLSNKSFPSRLTVGKVYAVRKVTHTCYVIKDDRGCYTWYGKSMFEMVY